MPTRADDKLATEWHALMTRYHHTSCALDRELSARHDLSVSEFEILQQLCVPGGGGSMRMHELGDVVHLSQSALSRLVTRLEKDGLVERCACADDRRSVVLIVTRAGAKRLEEARPTQRAILRAQATLVD
jgi:DNA-binding MarR family transcriptional regulator